jgi:hypothetical protein
MINIMDIQRIIDTDIPDIAPVYGGVRGRSMSSKGLGMVWPTIKEAGVKTVIELRCFDDSKKLPIICEKYGIDYFRFPIDRKVRNIEEIIAAFPRFCELIDKGDFYMACYHGLHRTDIAVSLYWVFYGADRGIEPPQIRGYREDEGRDTSKIMRVLNAMYARMTEINGVEPMPAEVFKERKRIINELSKR